MKKVVVIGAGFSGLSAATSLAYKGYEVTVLEKNTIAGGRARQFQAGGFTFDMGPSWYWMPDVFEEYFASFGKSVGDYYRLIRLNPSYRIFFSHNEIIDLPANTEALYDLFESIESGAGKKLRQFLAEAEYKYRVAMSRFVRKPSRTFLEYINFRLLKDALRLNLFTSFERYTSRYFSDPRLRQILEFPVLFLGGTGKTTPALYSLMNYCDMQLGTWYPEGGMYRVVEAMVRLAEEHGVRFVYNSPVSGFRFHSNRITEVITPDNVYPADYIVGTADYHHIEQELLPENYRKYSSSYWESRVMSPSSLIWYIGINRKLEPFLHHTLLFDEPFAPHAASIYERPAWPERPSLYVSVTSRTDPSVAPEGHENLFFLIPVAPGLQDTPEIRNHYLQIIIARIKKLTGIDITDHIVFKRSYGHSDFSLDYHAFKGNAYGLANTLFQTAFLKPTIVNPRVKNLVYAGQLTVPGPGVPPAIISGQIASQIIVKNDR